MPGSGHERQSNVTPLFPGNMTLLYRTPLYLYPNATRVLTCTLEQDPLKVFPVFEMTTEAQRDFYFSATGKLPRYLLPYLAQFRGLWQLDPDNNGQSRFRHYLDHLPITPDNNQYWGIQVKGAGYAPHKGPLFRNGDLWWATPAFYATVYIYIEGVLIATVTPPTSAVVEHQGMYSWPTVTFSGLADYGPDFELYEYPGEGAFAWSKVQTGPFVSLTHRSMGNVKHRGGGSDYEYVVEFTGMGKTIVTVTTQGKQANVRFAITQDEVRVPGDMGTQANTVVEYYGNSGPKQWHTQNIGGFYSEAPLQGGPLVFGGFGNIARPDFKVPDQWRTEYSASGSASTDSDFYDCADTGSYAGVPKYQVLGFARDLLTVDATGAGGVITEDWAAAVASPLLIGADKLYYDDSINAQMGADPMGYYYRSATASLTSEDTHHWFDHYMAIAKARATFCRAYAPPKIKLTMNLTSTGPTIEQNYEVTRYAYCDLPHVWNVLDQVTPDQWVPMRHADLDDYTDGGGITYTVTERSGLDILAGGFIGAGHVTCEVMANHDGLHFAKVDDSDNTLGDFYIAVDTYIFDHTDPVTYENWVIAKDALGEEI